MKNNPTLLAIITTIAVSFSAAAQQPDAAAIADAMHDPQPDGDEVRLINPEQRLTAHVGPDAIATLRSGEATLVLQVQDSGEGASVVLGDDGLTINDTVYTQHWLNTVRGLEHLIEVFDPETTSITVNVEGLVPYLDTEDAVVLRDDEGNEAMRYGGLAVFDARSQRQTAWFEAAKT